MAVESPCGYNDSVLQDIVLSHQVMSLKMRLSRNLSPNYVLSDTAYGSGLQKISLLQLAAYSEAREVVRVLLQSPNCDVNLFKGTGYPTPLQCACMYKVHRTSQTHPARRTGPRPLLAHLKSDSTNSGSGGRMCKGEQTLLGRPSYGDSFIANLLIHHGADVNRETGGLTALGLAVMNNNVPLAIVLLQAGADPCLTAKVHLRYLACNRGIEMLTVLCSHSDVRGGMVPAVPELRLAARHRLYEDGTTMLHIVCDATSYSPTLCIPPTDVAESQLQLVEWLIDAGATPDDTDGAGRTALHVAWQMSMSPDLCHLLLKHGASVDRLDVRGLRPFEAHDSGRTALHMVLGGNVFFPHCATSQVDPPLVSSRTFISRAAFANYLLDLNACDITAHTPTCGSTALHLLCKEMPEGEGLPVAQRLISLGAPVNVYNAQHETPLHLAVLSGRLDYTKVLLNAGADPMMRCHEYNVLQAMAATAPYDGIGEIAAYIIENTLVNVGEMTVCEGSDEPFLSSRHLCDPRWQPFHTALQRRSGLDSTFVSHKSKHVIPPAKGGRVEVPTMCFKPQEKHSCEDTIGVSRDAVVALIHQRNMQWKTQETCYRERERTARTSQQMAAWHRGMVEARSLLHRELELEEEARCAEEIAVKQERAREEHQKRRQHACQIRLAILDRATYPQGKDPRLRKPTRPSGWSTIQVPSSPIPPRRARNDPDLAFVTLQSLHRVDPPRTLKWAL